MNLFLIGYRCTGKTSAGKRLSRILGWEFVDTDRLVVDRAGLSIADIVARSGWKHFRRLEKNALASVCRLDRRVVATGGGIILDPENTAVMKRGGSVVWLTAAPETLCRRLEKDDPGKGFRPSLTGREPAAEVREILAERTPLYQGAADWIVDTEGRDVAAVCREILKLTGLVGYLG